MLVAAVAAAILHVVGRLQERFGPPLPRVGARLVADGELLLRGPVVFGVLAQLLRRLITSPEYWRGDELCHCTERYSRWLGCVAVVSYTFVIACAAFEDVAR